MLRAETPCSTNRMGVAEDCLLGLQGYYCPQTTAILTCPQGSFCKWWSKEPKSCPWLATCEAGAKSADLSLAGFFSMAAILLALWLTYMACDAYIRSAPALTELPWGEGCLLSRAACSANCRWRVVAQADMGRQGCCGQTESSPADLQNHICVVNL